MPAWELIQISWVKRWFTGDPFLPCIDVCVIGMCAIDW